MKKLVIIISVMVLCLSGCGSNEGNKAKSDTVKAKSYVEENVADKKKDVVFTESAIESPVVQTNTPSPTMELEITTQPVNTETIEPVTKDIEQKSGNDNNNNSNFAHKF